MAIHIYFGPPGCGKSTYAAMLAKKNSKKNIRTFCNFRVRGTYFFNVRKDFGVYNISDCDILIDEASIEFSNRDWKSFPDTMVYATRMHRHAHIGTISIFSQGFDDMDLTFRRLAVKTFMLKKITPWFTVCRPIVMFSDVDRETHQIVTGYKYKVGFPKIVFMPLYWKMFDSFELKKLPDKDFELVE